MTSAIIGAMLALNSSLAAAILAKLTLITTVALAASRLARGSRASVRHAMLAALFAALIAFPVASILVPPVRIALAGALAAPSRVTRTIDVGETGTPAEGSARVASSIWRRTEHAFTLHDLLLAAWMAGAAVFALRMIVGLREVHLLRRFGLVWRDGQAISDRIAAAAGIGRHVVVLLHKSLPAPVTCGIFRPAIVLPCDAKNWDGEDLNRAIIHELEHVRRGDWVSQCFARAVCAAYWFHPLVWIAWRRLSLEAERACDDAVLRRSEATAYADQLLGLARRLSTAMKSPAIAMVNRSDLSARVGAVLDGRRPRGKAGSLVVTACGALAIAVALAMSAVRIVSAQQPADAAPSTAVEQEFEAVSVKLVDPNSRGSHWHERSDAKYISVTGSMHGLILRTYGIREAQISGEPEWFNSRLYTIEAVTSAPATEKQMMVMLRGVLTDRFGLRLRQENRDLPVFALEVAPGGPKFRELKPGEAPTKHGEPSPDNYGRSFASVEELMNQLNGVFGGLPMAGRPIVDRTHLTGKYDLYLETERMSPPDDTGNFVRFPNLQRDMQSELGLRLVSDRGSMPCFVVEHAEAPTQN